MRPCGVATMRGPSSFQPTEGGAGPRVTEPNQPEIPTSFRERLWWLQEGALQRSDVGDLDLERLCRGDDFRGGRASWQEAGGLCGYYVGYTTGVPTGTGGGALADLQVETFEQLAPLQLVQHRFSFSGRSQRLPRVKLSI